VTTIDYKANTKYFRPISLKPGLTLFLVGLLFLGFGSSAAVLGLCLAGTGGFLIFQQFSGRPDDEYIDKQIESTMSTLRTDAMNKLGLTPEEVDLIDPIEVHGPLYRGMASLYHPRRGKDGIHRSNNCQGLVIFFAEQELHAYTFMISLTEPKEQITKTDVYFYRDVVSVATENKAISVGVLDKKPFSLTGSGKDGEGTVRIDQVILTTSGGTQIECAISSMTSKIEKNIQGARQLIRNKKTHVS
jgi:hypothetical protein